MPVQFERWDAQPEATARGFQVRITRAGSRVRGSLGTSPRCQRRCCSPGARVGSKAFEIVCVMSCDMGPVLGRRRRSADTLSTPRV